MTDRTRRTCSVARPARSTRAACCIAGVLVALIALCGAGCLLTNSFDNVAGVRPVDAGDLDVDASPDPDADGPTAPWCVSQSPVHQNCVDFDEGSLSGGGFTTSISNGGTVTLDTSQFSSAPAAFLTHIPAQIGITNSSGILVANLKIAPTAVHLGFDIRISDCRSAGGNGAITLAVMAPTRAVTYGLVIQPSNTIAFGEQLAGDAGMGFVPHNLVTAPQAGVWTRMTIDLTLTPGAATNATVKVGDTVALATTLSGVVLDGSPFLVNLGAFVTGPTGACEIDFDNVTFDSDP